MACLGTIAAVAVGAPGASAIVGGSISPAGSWPWAVQVINNNAGGIGGQVICGGVLVGPRRVVTDAHCVSGATAPDVGVLAGHAAYDGSQDLTAVSTITTYPGYQMDAGTDVAVLTLTATPPSPAVPIDILRPSDSFVLADGMSAQLAGWGLTDPNSFTPPTTQYEGTLTLDTENTCGVLAMLCSQSPSPSEPCFGDDGGPVIVNVAGSSTGVDPSPSNGTWRLIALPEVEYNSCAQAFYADLTVPAMRAFASQPWKLSVAHSGAGFGRVTGPHISCPSTCSHTYADGTAVTLRATPAANSLFAGWSGGGGCAGTGACHITLHSSVRVTARFIIKRTLHVVKKGTGAGTVKSSPAGINCGHACSAGFGNLELVTLTATAAPGSRFTGWSGGGCSGTRPCEVTMSADETVTARFAKR